MTNAIEPSDDEVRELVAACNRGNALIKNCFGLVPDMTRGGFVLPGVVPWVTAAFTEYPGLGLKFLETDGISAAHHWRAIVTTPIRYYDSRSAECTNTLPFVLIDHRDQTPAHLVSFQRLMIDAKLDPNLTDKYGNTLLHFCAQNNRAEFAKVLLEAGADPSRPSEQPMNATPLELAGYLGHAEVAHVIGAHLAQKKIESVISGVLPQASRIEEVPAPDKAPARMSLDTFAYMRELGAKDFQSVLFGLAKRGDHASLSAAIEAGLLVEENAKGQMVVSDNHAFQIMWGLADAGVSGIASLPKYVDRILDQIPDAGRFEALADIFVRLATTQPREEFVRALLAYSQKCYPDFLERPVPGKKTGAIKRTVLALIVDSTPAAIKQLLPILVGPDYPGVPLASPSLDLYTYARDFSKSSASSGIVFENMPRNDTAYAAMGKLALQALSDPKITFLSQAATPNRSTGVMIANLIALGGQLTKNGWRKIAEAAMPRQAGGGQILPFPAQLIYYSAPLVAEPALDALLRSGAVDVDHKLDGDTLLHLAARQNNTWYARKLIAAGADPLITNDDGETPRQLIDPTPANGYEEMAQMLEAAAARQRIDQVLSAANLARNSP